MEHWTTAENTFFSNARGPFTMTNQILWPKPEMQLDIPIVKKPPATCSIASHYCFAVANLSLLHLSFLSSHSFIMLIKLTVRFIPLILLTPVLRILSSAWRSSKMVFYLREIFVPCCDFSLNSQLNWILPAVSSMSRVLAIRWLFGGLHGDLRSSYSLSLPVSIYHGWDGKTHSVTHQKSTFSS